jgi:hypothetical protein
LCFSANLLVSGNWRVKVADFGAASFFQSNFLAGIFHRPSLKRRKKIKKKMGGGVEMEHIETEERGISTTK